MQHRVLANNDFAEAGYEVNVNFGPVIVKDGWQSDYVELLGMLDAALSGAGKATRRGGDLFDPHRGAARGESLVAPEGGEAALASGHPGAEDFASKRRPGAPLRKGLKRGLVREFKDLLDARLPYCEIRYAF